MAAAFSIVSVTLAEIIMLLHLDRPVQAFVVALAVFASVRVAVAEPAVHRADAKVSAATRIDWVFALSNQSPATPPADWLPRYDSTAQTYELYVPANLKKDEPPGLILFISPGDRGMGLSALRAACDAQNLIFASPHAAGNNTETRQRVRIVLDVLDDVRRAYGVDPDRTYLAGFSGGGRIACAIGFSLPEYCGGVIPVCAAGDLREESWLRHRVRDRLSVAHLTGETDFNRGEVERFRGPMLAAVGVRSKIWVAPKTGHAVPAANYLTEAVAWLDEGLATRRKLASEYPASRIAAKATPTREEQAGQLLAEGKRRLGAPATLYSGLMQAKGVSERWPDLPTARVATALLTQYEQAADRAWEREDIAEQRMFLIARAKSLSDYATGPLPAQYQGQRPNMAKGAIQLWNLVIQDGQDEAAAAEGKRRLPDLQKLADGDGK